MYLLVNMGRDVPLGKHRNGMYLLVNMGRNVPLGKHRNGMYLLVNMGRNVPLGVTGFSKGLLHSRRSLHMGTSPC